MGLWGAAMISATSASSLYATDTQTLTVEYTLDKDVQEIWQGDDTVETGGGDGKVTLKPGVPKTAILKVECNSTNGYTIKFSSGNATAADASIMITGAGGDPKREIPYSVSLDISAISNATAVGSLDLQDVGNSKPQRSDSCYG